VNYRTYPILVLLVLLLFLSACVAPITPPPASGDISTDKPASGMAGSETASTTPVAPEEATTSDDSIVGVMWLWQNLQDASGEKVVDVPNPESYRLMLQPDGTFNFKADCNNGGGEYVLDGSSISLMPGPMTAAACAPDPLADRYVALLPQMDTVAGDGHVMNLTSSSDDTTMNFTKFYAVTGRIVGLEGASLPQPAEVEVWVNDVSLSDAPAKQVGGQTISNATQFPVTFEATYDAVAIDEKNSYALTVRISDGQGNLKFINTQNIPVLTQGNPTYGIEVLVDAVK
jgi:uncharacterized lipoprotein YbaY/heat shock protein HslJ